MESKGQTVPHQVRIDTQVLSCASARREVDGPVFYAVLNEK